MQDAKEEVRTRLNIEDVVGEYVQLKRAGRNFKGLSPFSAEKTPSFFVSPDKNIWHDFSSNKGGDIFAFVMEVEGMDFRQALEHLARRAGVELSQYDTASSKVFADRKKRLYEAHQLAVKYYQQCLLRNRHAMEYVFNDRQLDKAAVTDFAIGYAPDTGTALVGALTKRGFTKKELADAGLSNRYGGDMFRGRMMVPLMDGAGQVVGFTGRIMGDVPNAPKYLNTPQTLLYDKGRQVFGLSQAKQAIREKGYVVIVEGNLDVVSSHQAGVRQTVATAGTAMTEHHLKSLKRLTSDVRLAFDSDKAGVAATERAIGLSSHMDIDLSIITLPDGAKDPDELIRHDPALWHRATEDVQPAVDWVLAQYQTRLDLKTAAGKRDFTTAALAVVRTLGDPIEQEHYEHRVAEMTGSSYEAVHAKLSHQSTGAPALKTIKISAPVEAPAYLHEDDALAVATIDVPSRELFEHFDIGLLHGDERRALARYLVVCDASTLHHVPPELQNHDNYVKMVLLRAETRYAEWDSNERYYETARLIRQIEHEHKKQTQEKLIDELREAEQAGDEPTAERLRLELNTLIKEIARGRR
jgi:DNA primase